MVKIKNVFLECFDAAGDNAPYHEVIFWGDFYGLVIIVFGNELNDVFFNFDAFYGEFAVDLANGYFVVLGFQAFVNDE